MTLLWLKAAHLLAVVTFVGGLLLTTILLHLLHGSPVPRLPQERRLVVAVRHWDRAVTTPALALVWLLGMAMAVRAGWMGAPWLLGKLVLVAGLSAWHGLQAGWLQRLVADQVTPPRWTRRVVGPLLAAVAGCVLLVVLKPS
ncbi:CopD family protein [Schlegelella sp. S2-27]|uniref:Protoporphyrinogen IX oxidase n=1 Tax=Caldimonas mangrovi TaxID=2944811 RepID=A0ABT0YY92_9BURK|nr:CopD family protein [Caldimonas mangrovi]MCM5682803.1 CopD family protein [Caldimonas mangrovi]